MFLSSYHHEIFRSYYQWQKWCPCKRLRSEVKGQGHRGRNPIYPFPDCNSCLNWHMMMKWCTKLDVAWERCPIVFQCHPSNFKVIRLKKSPILTKIEWFRTVTQAWIHQWLWNNAQSLKQHRRHALLFFKVIRQISRSRGTKNRRFWPELSVSGLVWISWWLWNGAQSLT